MYYSAYSYIFSTSGYLEAARSPSRLVAGALWHRFILAVLHGPPHTAPSFYPVCTHTCLIQFSSHSWLNALPRMFLVSDTYTRLPTTENVMSVIHVCLFSENDYAFAFFGGWPCSSRIGSPPGKVLSLLTTIRNVYKDYELNIISGLSMIFHKTIAPIALTLTLWCLSRRNSVSTVHAYSSFVASHREALPS